MSPWQYIAPYRRGIIFGVLCQIVASATVMAIPWILKGAIDLLRTGHVVEVQYAALTIVALALVACVARIASRRLIYKAGIPAEYDLRRDLLDKLLQLSPSYFRRIQSGDLVSRLTGDVTALRSLWGTVPLNIMSAPNILLVMIGSIVLMVRISPSLTLYALATYPFALLGSVALNRAMFRRARAVQDQLGRLSGAINEDVGGAAVVKAYALEAARADGFAAASDAFATKSMALNRLHLLVLRIFVSSRSVTAIVTLWVGGTRVANNEMSLGGFVAFGLYTALLVAPMLTLGGVLSMLQRGRAGWSRCSPILREEPTIVDGDGPPLAEPVRGDIEIRDLDVTHGDRRVLAGVSLRARPGEIVAIVGRIGAGKTSVVDAVPRLVEVPAGTVFIDGRDASTLPLASLRAAIAYAPQDAFLFSATIADNIAYGRRLVESAVARRAAVVRAAEAAGLAHDLAEFVDGLDTMIGERGITLSGGQRQRVALARALAADSPILILDDSLSSVDAQTERTILAELYGPSRARRTTILISHRIAAVAPADRILVLDDGAVAETGTHGELVASGGVYASLYREQLTKAPLVAEDS